VGTATPTGTQFPQIATKAIAVATLATGWVGLGNDLAVGLWLGSRYGPLQRAVGTTRLGRVGRPGWAWPWAGDYSGTKPLVIPHFCWAHVGNALTI
jgi:hypothetical protein